jgi:redox-sensitive bicupin YhaK (pirin superfamily)
VTVADSTTSPVRETVALGARWPTVDPFLFCAHHDDDYPAGDDVLAPAVPIDDREIGMDFSAQDGWSMYHGDVVPGFPQHPHRGFETVTFVRQGYIDHSDSLGATARFGQGDVQWLTAGRGILHAEMFPLLDEAGPNPLELFQIWLNLPQADKFVEPHFSMLWAGAIPAHRVTDDVGRSTEITIVAGRFGEVVPPPPPPHSWAARPEADVAIWTIVMAPGALFTLPRALAKTNRTLNFFRGSSLVVEGRTVESQTAISLRPDAEVTLANGPETSELLLLQGRPMGETVVQYGPFVMNSRAEIEQAIADYRRTSFGGWPWPSPGPVHARDAGRFAKHADGRIEQGR